MATMKSGSFPLKNSLVVIRELLDTKPLWKHYFHFFLWINWSCSVSSNSFWILLDMGDTAIFFPVAVRDLIGKSLADPTVLN